MGKTNSITIEQVMALRPCYSESRTKEIFAGRDALIFEDILNLDIPAKDRIWFFCRSGFLSDSQKREWAYQIAENILLLFKKEYPKNKIARQVIELTYKFIIGKVTQKELVTINDITWRDIGNTVGFTGVVIRTFLRAIDRISRDISIVGNARDAVWFTVSDVGDIVREVDMDAVFENYLAMAAKIYFKDGDVKNG